MNSSISGSHLQPFATYSTQALRKAITLPRKERFSNTLFCSGEKGGDEFDFKPYERTGEKLFEEIFKTKHAVVRTTKRTVQVNYTFSRDLDKQDMLRYLKVEHKELIAGFKENVEC